MAVAKTKKISISNYLEKRCKLWVFDFDNTIINNDAYVIHNMKDDTIANLTDDELLRDMPHYKYFYDLILYLFQKGIKIGIASFGVYTIIRAYMDRIFGFNQRYFDKTNIKAFQRNMQIATAKSVRRLPPNKNAMIYDLMKFYKITSFGNVVLFDDAPSNIADASYIGIIAIQIDNLLSPDIMCKIDSNLLQEDYNTSHVKPKYSNLGTRKLGTIYDIGTFDMPATTTTTTTTTKRHTKQHTKHHTKRHPNKMTTATTSHITKSNIIEPFYNGDSSGFEVRDILDYIVKIGFIIAMLLFIYKISATHSSEVIIFWIMVLFFIIISIMLKI